MIANSIEGSVSVTILPENGLYLFFWKGYGIKHFDL